MHPKDPTKRIDILPSNRAIEIQVDGHVVARTSSALHLIEPIWTDTSWSGRSRILCDETRPLLHLVYVLGVRELYVHSLVGVPRCKQELCTQQASIKVRRRNAGD